MRVKPKYDHVKAKADAAESLASKRQRDMAIAAGKKLPRVRVRVDLLEESASYDEQIVEDTPTTVTKPKLGRPPKYDKKFCPIIARMRAGGEGYYDIAEKLGVAYSTLWRWSTYHNAIREALDTPVDAKAVRLTNSKVREAIERCATGYTHNGVYYPPSPAAQRLWARNKMRDEFPDGLQLTGPNGGPIQQQVIDFDPAKLDMLTPQELMVLESVMRKMQTGPAKSEQFAMPESKDDVAAKDKAKAAKYAKSLH